MSVPLAEWVSLFNSEYLSDFLPSGGSTFKVLVGPVTASAAIISAVAESSRSSGFATAIVSAGDTRTHMIDQVFMRVAQQIDWQVAAEMWLRLHLQEMLVVIPDGTPLTDVDTIAEASQIDKRTLGVRVNQAIMKGIVRDGALWSEFRYGMSSYCVGRITGEESELVIKWLRSERVPLPQLKKLRIRQRIVRGNARPILSSSAIWLRECGFQGLVVILDLSAVFDDIEGSSARLSRAMLLDLYEVLRQFIDETDITRHLAVIAIAGPGIIEDSRRSYNEYEAFKLRVVDDVRDPLRDNPLNCLVRIDASGAFAGAAI